MIKRNKERKCWTTSIDRIKTVRKEFQNIKKNIKKENFLNTSNQRP